MINYIINITLFLTVCDDIAYPESNPFYKHIMYTYMTIYNKKRMYKGTVNLFDTSRS